MTFELAIVLVALGLAGGFFSGWLGIGGGIIMAPLLLYVPSWLGVGELDMKVVAGLTMIQSLFATGSAVVIHHRLKYVSRSLVAWMGSVIAMSMLAGALLSRYVSADVLLGILALMAAIAAITMFFPLKEDAATPLPEAVDFNRAYTLIFALVIGLLGGLVGQSGAFIIIPFMLYVLRIPTRITIGSSLGVVFLAAAAGTLGKMLSGQIDYFMALFCVSGALLGAQLGSRASPHTRKKMLRTMLALIIAAAALRMIADIVVD
jgi:uncharacterized membrane protein YfcA